MPSIKRIVREIKNRGFFRYAATALNCRVYAFYTKRRLSENCFTFPIHLQVEVSRACNLRCRMCEYSFQKNNGAVMPFKEFCRVLARFPLLYSLDLTGIGEPFCNPDFMRIVLYSTKKGIKTGFATNGLLLTEGQMEGLIEGGIDSVSFSVDASSPEAYERIREGGSFAKLKQNITLFSAKIAAGKQRKPTLSLNYTISRENLSEVTLFPALARALGVGTVFYRDLIVFPSGNYTQTDRLDNLPEDKRLEFKKDILREGARAGVRVNFCESLLTAGQPRKKFCFRPWMSSFIDVYGNFYPCCHLTQKNTQISAFRFGNLLEQDSSELWNAPRMRALRKGLVAPGVVPAICRGCDCLRK